jgi:hypothetical protein
MPQPAGYEHRPLRACPPETLAALRAQVVALLRFQDLLPADLYVKLGLLRDDISAVISPPAVPRARHSRRTPALWLLPGSRRIAANAPVRLTHRKAR